MKKIRLGKKDIYALVDDEFVVKPEYCLAITGHGYPRANIYRGKVGNKYKYESIYLHHLVIGKPPKGLVTDHINRDKLDNRKSNLRFIPQSGNCINKSKQSNNHSSYKGVHYSKKHAKYSTGKPWVAQITKSYKKSTLGFFATPKEAALAYNVAAKKLHGKYAYLNELS